MMRYYILTPYQKVDLFVTTLLFFVIFLVVRPMILGEPVNGQMIGNMTILFFVWYGMTFIMTNSLVISNQKLTNKTLWFTFIFECEFECKGFSLDLS